MSSEESLSISGEKLTELMKQERMNLETLQREKKRVTLLMKSSQSQERLNQKLAEIEEQIEQKKKIYEDLEFQHLEYQARFEDEADDEEGADDCPEVSSTNTNKEEAQTSLAQLEKMKKELQSRTEWEKKERDKAEKEVTQIGDELVHTIAKSNSENISQFRAESPSSSKSEYDNDDNAFLEDGFDSDSDECLEDNLRLEPPPVPKIHSSELSPSSGKVGKGKESPSTATKKPQSGGLNLYTQLLSSPQRQSPLPFSPPSHFFPQSKYTPQESTDIKHVSVSSNHKQSSPSHVQKSPNYISNGSVLPIPLANGHSNPKSPLTNRKSLSQSPSTNRKSDSAGVHMRDKPSPPPRISSSLTPPASRLSDITGDSSSKPTPIASSPGLTRQRLSGGSSAPPLTTFTSSGDFSVTEQRPLFVHADLNTIQEDLPTNPYYPPQSPHANESPHYLHSNGKMDSGSSDLSQEPETSQHPPVSMETSLISGIRKSGRKRNMEIRPLTRYLPVTDPSFHLRRHIESSGHQLDTPQTSGIRLDAHTCSGTLCKLGGRFKTWHKKWFVFDRQRRTLAYYSGPTSVKIKGCISFADIMDVFVDHLHRVRSPQPNSTFCLETRQSRTLFLMTASPEQMRIWVDVIFTGAEGYLAINPPAQPHQGHQHNTAQR